MKCIAFTEDEMSLLEEIPHQQFVLYVKLRWFMDRDSFLVGIKRSISLLTLAQELHVAPVRGRHAGDSGTPSKKAVRSALDGLIAIGLIEPFGNGEKLIFRMPVASRALARPNDEGHMRGTSGAQHEGHSETVVVTEFHGDEGHMRGIPQDADEGHVIRGKGNSSFSVVNAAAALPVDNFEQAPEPVLLPLHVRMGEWLREQEKRRGKVLRIRRDDETVSGWADGGVTMEMLSTAYEMALADREMQNNPHPLNVSFIGIFVGRLMDGGSKASRGSSGSRVPWFFDNKAFNARAAELGLAMRQEDSRGKAYSEWRKRVYLEAGVTREEFIVACRDRGNGRVDFQFVEYVWGAQ